VSSVTALQTRPRVLTEPDVAELRALVQRDRVLNCVIESRLDFAPDLDSRRLGGFVWGMNSGIGDSLRAAIFHGGNLMPVGEDLQALEVIAAQLARANRGCSSIVGSALAVQTIWPVLSRRWGRARAIRECQPLLATSRPAHISPDPAVRAVAPAELAIFLPAAVAMFSEELGASPTGQDGGTSYRARVADLIAASRAFARFDRSGRIEFKAEIGALACGTAQLQGVWVRPDLRGRGIGTACMAAVLELGLQRAPTVSLYVNDYNTAARRMYARLGMRQVGIMSTVLF
jgi:predicted GNAT family acetyltransferase